MQLYFLLWNRWGEKMLDTILDETCFENLNVPEQNYENICEGCGKVTKQWELGYRGVIMCSKCLWGFGE